MAVGEAVVQETSKFARDPICGKELNWYATDAIIPESVSTPHCHGRCYRRCAHRDGRHHIGLGPGRA